MMKLGEGSNWILGRSQPREYKLRMFDENGFLRERFHLFEKFVSRLVNLALALAQANERRQSIREEPFGLSVREARESPEMSPIRTGEIAAELFGELLCGPTAHVVIESLSVI